MVGTLSVFLHHGSLICIEDYPSRFIKKIIAHQPTYGDVNKQKEKDQHLEQLARAKTYKDEALETRERKDTAATELLDKLAHEAEQKSKAHLEDSEKIAKEVAFLEHQKNKK